MKKKNAVWYSLLLVILFIQACTPATVATPTASGPDVDLPTMTLEPPTPVPPTPTREPEGPTPTPTFEPPANTKPYQDALAGVSVQIPDSWIVTQIDPGRFAILQSYPVDKYVGGEGFQPGDTKCDLAIRPPEIDIAGHMQQLKANTDLTILSEDEVVLQSGQPGTRLEVESLGLSLAMITEVNDRVVVLTCFGEAAPFDGVAGTLAEIPVVTTSTGLEPPPGFRLYHDSAAGFGIFIPETWIVTNSDPGFFAILQSYPEGKYIGGEAREPGDTKCDVNIRPRSAADLLTAWRSNPDTTIVFETAVILPSGLPGTRLEIDSMGSSQALVTEIHGQAVSLTCWGNFAPFEDVALSLHPTELQDAAPTSAPDPILYEDSAAGISVQIPGSWTVTDVVPDNLAVLQSYPEGKYIGGEALLPGDTKCDLFIRPPDISLAEYVQDLKATPALTILSETEIVLNSGESALRLEVESMGRAVMLITEIKARVVFLNCIGDPAPIDDIAVTLRAIE